jgi:hypothetical protein
LQWVFPSLEFAAAPVTESADGVRAFKLGGEPNFVRRWRSPYRDPYEPCRVRDDHFVLRAIAARDPVF